MVTLRVSVLVCVLLALVARSWPLVLRLWRITQPLDVQKNHDALRVAMLGASLLGRVALVHVADKRPDVRIVAVASRDAARAASFAARHGISSVYSGVGAYQEVLESVDVDAVYICLPTTLHAHWARRALEAGKHVLVEKPIATSATEAALLQQVAVRSGRVLMEAAHHRYHPAMRRTGELISSLGSLSSIDVRFSQWSPKAWWESITTPHGVPVPDIRSHERTKNLDRWWYCADVLSFVTGASSVEVLSAVEGKSSFRAEVILSSPSSGQSDEVQRVNATMYYARDDLSSPFDWSLTARGMNGSVSYSNLGFPFVWHAIDRDTTVRGQGRDQLYGNGETTFEHQLAVFLEAVRGTPLMHSFLPTMELVDKLFAVGGRGPLFQTS